jgi:Protein of unknown function (DUF2950)
MFNNFKVLLWTGMLVVLAGLLSTTVPAREKAQAVAQTTFVSPDEAVKALVADVRDDNDAGLAAIFGPESEDLISSGDKVADRNGRKRFLKAYAEKNFLQRHDDNRTVLHVGKADYAFPIPIVRRNGRWIFDTPAGREEILNRRIGRNELRTIKVLYAYGDAQRDYADRLQQNGGTGQFAQRLISTKGNHDGLYWPTVKGEKESPFGPLIARAGEAGYSGKLMGKGAEPFNGYYFKILTAQGPHATGGAFDYLVNGKLILGFGLVAYPARYGSTGVNTFIVNQEGVVYEKDLGEKTDAAAAMTTFDPDNTWQQCKEPPE